MFRYILYLKLIFEFFRIPKVKKVKKVKKVLSQYEIDKRNLLKYSELYYGVLGHFINSHPDPKRYHYDWNYLIWQPKRNLKAMMDYIDLLKTPLPLPPPPVLPPLPPPLPVVVKPKPVRKALRRFKQFPDVPAESVEDRCKVCMINKKIVGFFPCGHVGMCNSCCAKTYKKKFMTSLRLPKPYLQDCLPLSPTDVSFDYNNEEEFIEGIINELTRPHFHHSKKCIFCKERIESFNLIYSI